jgi:hypothetical protein
MADDGWERTSKGTIFAHPLTSFQSTEGGLVVVWRLEWIEAKPGSARQRAKSIQVHMDANTALQIGEKIVRGAKASLAQRDGGGRH